MNEDKEPQHNGSDSIEAAENDLQEKPALGHRCGTEGPQGDVQEMGDHQCPELPPQGVDAIGIGTMWAGVQCDGDGARIGQEVAAAAQAWWGLQRSGHLFWVLGLALQTDAGTQEVNPGDEQDECHRDVECPDAWPTSQPAAE